MSKTKKQCARAVRFLQNRLSPEGYAGLHLTIGVLVVLFAGWCFGEIAEDVWGNEALAQFDERLAFWFNQHATPAITHLAKAITFFGSVAWLSTVTILIVVFFVYRRDWLNVLLVAITMAGGGILNALLKHYFHRHRPILENPLVTLSSYGFPSGHTMGATLLYGLLALLAVRSFKSHAARVTCVITACLMIGLIGLTRIYLGVHYLSDVLGAITAGILWLAFCWTAVETLRRRRQ